MKLSHAWSCIAALQGGQQRTDFLIFGMLYHPTTWAALWCGVARRIAQFDKSPSWRPALQTSCFANRIRWTFLVPPFHLSEQSRTRKCLRDSDFARWSSRPECAKKRDADQGQWPRRYTDAV